MCGCVYMNRWHLVTIVTPIPVWFAVTLQVFVSSVKELYKVTFVHELIFNKMVDIFSTQQWRCGQNFSKRICDQICKKGLIHISNLQVR